MPRMALLQENYISEIRPYRFPAGAIVDVDQDTADRWLEEGVAEPATQSEKTFREQERARLRAQLEELDQDEGSFSKMVNRDSSEEMPSVRKSPRRPRTPSQAAGGSRLAVRPTAELAAAAPDDDGGEDD